MSSQPLHPFSTARLCVIGEADPFLANLLHRFAQKAGLRVKRAQTGEAVLEFAQREKPAVVILDPDLPGKCRGWEAAQALRSGEKYAQLPLIVCTWLSAAEVDQRIGPHFAYLQKPDLHYLGFTEALEKAGYQTHPNP